MLVLASILFSFFFRYVLFLKFAIVNLCFIHFVIEVSSVCFPFSVHSLHSFYIIYIPEGLSLPVSRAFFFKKINSPLGRKVPIGKAALKERSEVWGGNV